jgi:hypothetical protein
MREQITGACTGKGLSLICENRICNGQSALTFYWDGNSLYNCLTDAHVKGNCKMYTNKVDEGKKGN